MIAIWLRNFSLLASRLSGRLVVGIDLLRRSLASLLEGLQTVMWIGRVDPAPVRTATWTAAEAKNDFPCHIRLSGMDALLY